MASLSTGEMYTDEEVSKMTEPQKSKLKIVGITPKEQELLNTMNRKDRRAWLKKNKKHDK